MMSRRTAEAVGITQEDPIGLAGGMNLYGFAGGDRINFSDPMGLCPEGQTGAAGFCSSPGAALGMAIMGSASPAVGALGGILGRGAASFAAWRTATNFGKMGGSAGEQIFEGARQIGSMGLSQGTATRAIQQVVSKLGFDQGPTVSIGGANYILSKMGGADGVSAIAVNSAGAVSRALVQFGKGGWELVKDMGAIAAKK